MSQVDSGGTLLAQPVQTHAQIPTQIPAELQAQLQSQIHPVPQVQVVLTSGVPDASQIQTFQNLVAQPQATTVHVQMPNQFMQTSPGNKMGKIITIIQSYHTYRQHANLVLIMQSVFETICM